MTPCILFEGLISEQGYGRIYIGNGRSRNAHRVLWERTNGPVPEGRQLDHLCRNRACINLQHLELVTPKENTLRGIGPTAKNARKLFCYRGHSFTPDNTRIKNGTRICRICKKIYEDRYKAKNQKVLAQKALARYYRNREAALSKVRGA